MISDSFMSSQFHMREGREELVRGGGWGWRVGGAGSTNLDLDMGD